MPRIKTSGKSVPYGEEQEGLFRLYVAVIKGEDVDTEEERVEELDSSVDTEIGAEPEEAHEKSDRFSSILKLYLRDLSDCPVLSKMKR